MIAPPGWRLEIHEELPSTQDACIARAEGGEEPGLAILARRQSAGRGSRGRNWSEPPTGNLAVTVLPRTGPSGSAAAMGAWPFVAALALHEALSDRSRLGGLALKWPNDVLLDGRKLAGILVERGIGGAGAKRDWVAIGFGANLAAAPVIPGRELACLAELEPAPAPEVVAVRLMAALDRWGGVLRADGFGAVGRAWERLAHPRGSPLVVRDGRGQVGGSFAGIAEDGALLLDTAGGVRRFATGEVLSAPPN